MSSAARAGPPPNRHEPTATDGPAGGSHIINGENADSSSGFRGKNRPLPHIDDLLAARPHINALAPIRRLLIEGDTYAKQAETHLDFRRPDIALQEYIKASIIIVDIVPRHKDYPELKSDRGDLHRLYAGLQKRINTLHGKFEGIKEIIKEDNVRSRVQPTVLVTTWKDSISEQQREPRSRPLSGQIQVVQKQLPGSADMLPDDQDSGLSDIVSFRSSPPPHAENAPARRKPPVQPKPNSLHGKAIKPEIPSDYHLNSPKEDLAARFSRLRGAESHSSAQDPRIRTRPIGTADGADLQTKRGLTGSPSSVTNNSKPRPDRPAGPRDMPKATTGPPIPQKVPISVDIPSMPKLPDAIYSPAWNSENPANLDMPQSTNRYGMGRPQAVSPTTQVSHSSIATSVRNSQSAPPHTSLNGTGPGKKFDRELTEPPTVTAEELMKLLQRGSHEISILLVDIRNRGEFDIGHIMYHSIICIEPITLRKEISADELEQSLVLAPDAEQRLFEARDTFDLVVYYDQSSSSSEHKVPSNSGDETVLRDFCKAVYDYGYEKRLKKLPRLLVGGLDAWIDLVGLGALETPQLSNSISSRSAKSGVPSSSRAVRVREKNIISPRRKTHEVRPLSKEEQEKWEEAFKEDTAAIDPDAFSYVRTTEDFFRRFPEPSAIQESMVSPPPLPNFESSNKATHSNIGADMDTPHQEPLMPQIPTRPAPALPRQSYSGVSERTKFSNATDLVASPLAFKETESISNQVCPYGRMGISNYGATCYMNAVYQALKGTREFRRFMTSWSPDSCPVPMAPNEKELPRQLLMRQFKNMFTQLCAGMLQYYQPKKLRAYIFSIHEAPKEEKFGGDHQHDAEEFLLFILERLEDELNEARDKRPLLELTASQFEVRRRQPDIRSSWMEWQRHLHNNNSIISRKFCGQTINYITCLQCGFVQKSWETWLDIQLEIPEIKEASLEQSLNKRFNIGEPLDGYRCDSCKHCAGERRDRLSRCPEILVIMLRRHGYDKTKGQYKLGTRVTFPLDGLSMDPYFISLDGRGPEELDSGVLKPFTYDCYAVIQHRGNRTSSGHYWTLVKERAPEEAGREAWFIYDDTKVNRINKQEVLNITQSIDTYMLFYQRRKG